MLSLWWPGGYITEVKIFHLCAVVCHLQRENDTPQHSRDDACQSLMESWYSPQRNSFIKFMSLFPFLHTCKLNIRPGLEPEHENDTHSQNSILEPSINLNIIKLNWNVSDSEVENKCKHCEFFQDFNGIHVELLHSSSQVSECVSYLSSARTKQSS